MDITSKNRNNLKQAVSSPTLQPLADTPPFQSSTQRAQSPLQTEENQTLNKDKNGEPEMKYSMQIIHLTVKCCTMICHMLTFYSSSSSNSILSMLFIPRYYLHQTRTFTDLWFATSASLYIVYTIIYVHESKK